MEANIFFRKLIIIALSLTLCFISVFITIESLEEGTFVKSDSPIAAVENKNHLDDANFSLPEAKASLVSTGYQTTKAFEQYQPRYAVANIDSSNYGDRFSTDVNGKVLDNQPIAVLHETVGSATSAINTFRRSNSNDNHQSSYHALITLDGTIVYLVPADKRAYGAGNSVFKSLKGIETVQTNPNLPASVNNFAYHISLETPPDGRKKSGDSYHSGYTDGQYKSLAWLLALSSIPDERITTHKEVDLSGHRFDPRSFNFDKFFDILHTYRQPTLGKVLTN